MSENDNDSTLYLVAVMALTITIYTGLMALMPDLGPGLWFVFVLILSFAIASVFVAFASFALDGVRS